MKATPLAIITFSEDPPKEVLERVRAQIEKSIRQRADAVISPHASNALPASIHAHVVHGRAIVVDSDKTWAKYVNEGTAGSTLYSLIGKVVPLRLKSGVTIFRRVTEEALRRGRWHIPPKAGTNFVSGGVQAAMASDPAFYQYGADIDLDIEEVYV